MFNDSIQTQVIGTLKIFDKDTGETLVKKRNAIHPGNMAYIIASALSGNETSVNVGGNPPKINWMAFGNGGTSSTTTLSYRSPKISEIYDGLPLSSSSSRLYSKTYQQQLIQNRVYAPGEEMDDGELVPNRTAKVKFRVDVSHTDYEDMVKLDKGISLPNTDSNNDAATVTAYTIDEIGLISASEGSEMIEDKSLLVTHVTFHPVLLSANRTIVVDYTITIQIS